MASSDNRYDFWINPGTTNPLGFNTNISKDHPYERSTADYRKEQFNSAAGTGDTALTGWWTEGQLSFHGGEGLRFDSEWTPVTDIRIDTGSNLDLYTAGYAKVGLATSAVSTLHTTYTSMSVMNSAGLVVAQGAAGTVDVIDSGGSGTDNKTFSEFPVPGGTLTTHPGIAGDATAYIVTDNTIERCWHRTPPAPAIRQWTTNPTLAGSGTILPFLASPLAFARASGGVSNGTYLIATAPEATVGYNLLPDPSFTLIQGGTTGPWRITQGGTNIYSSPAASATVPPGGTTQNKPTSSVCGFIETFTPSATTPYVIATDFVLPSISSGYPEALLAFQVAANDAWTPTTATASITWDVGGTTSSAITVGTAWSLVDFGSWGVPVGASSGTLQITIQPNGTAHTAGKGIYITDAIYSPAPVSSKFWSGAYPPPGMSASFAGGVAYGLSVATSGATDRPVMVTIKTTGFLGIVSSLPYAFDGSDYVPTGQYQQWTSGSTTTIAYPTTSVGGLVSLFVNTTGTISVVSVVDIVKPALTDATSSYSLSNWTWDGATNNSTQTFTGNYYSEPLAWLPTTTSPASGQIAPKFIGAWFAKGRLIALDNNGNWSQASPSSRHILGPQDIFWTVPIEIANTSSPWSVHEGPDGIYIAHDHRVWLAQLDTTSSAGPTVTQVASVANDEVIRDFAYYLGQLITVTDKGIRSGRLNLYGRLIIGPRFALGSYTACTPWDDTVLVSGTESVTGVSGVFAVSMVTDVDQNTTVPAWWNVWQGTPPASLGASVGSPSASWNPDGGFTTRPSFNAPVVLSATGTISTFAANSAASGSLTTTRIRMGTLENKIFRYLTVRTSGASGTVAVSVILPDGTSISLGTVNAGSIGTWDLETRAGFPQQGAEYVQFQFTISGAASLTGWQIKAQPNPTRQRMIKVPLALFDTETSIYGSTSYTSAAKRLLALEALENANAMITYKDNTTGDSGSAYIESIQVVRMAPASAQANGGGPSFGGTIELTLRKA